MYQRVEDIPLVKRGLQNPDPVSYDISGTSGTHIDHTVNVFRADPERYPYVQIRPPGDMIKMVMRGNKDNGKVGQGDLVRAFEGCREFSNEDLVHAFKVITSSSTRMDIDWDEDRLGKIISEVESRAQVFTEEQMMECVHCLSIVHRYREPQPKKLHQIKQTLDLISARRIQTQMKRGDPGLLEERNRNDCYKMAFLWVKVGLVTNENSLDWNFLYLRSLWAFLEDGFIKKLSPGELVFMMFLVGLFRQFPGLNYGRKQLAKKFLVPEYFSSKFLDVIDDLSIDEIGIIAHVRISP